jgi:drug/metabolite transporter (DMT)-like permease
MTIIGARSWEPMLPYDWAWMAALCVTGAVGHWLLIKTYEVAEASSVQPFAYLQLVFASAIGVLVLGETIRPNVALGGAIVIGAGLFTLWRARQKAE